MSSLPEKYGEKEITTPFAFIEDQYNDKGELIVKGYTYKESSDGAMPTVATIQKMHLVEGIFTVRMLYVWQFLYELGPLTAKEIEWAFSHPDVDPYERKIGVSDPYKQEISHLLKHGILVKGDVKDGNDKKRVRCYRLTPSAEQYYKADLLMQRRELFSAYNAVKAPQVYDVSGILRALSASMYAIRLGVFRNGELDTVNRRFDECGQVFDGKYYFKDGKRQYVLSVRNIRKEYGLIMDAMMLPHLKREGNCLIVIAESIEKAVQIRQMLKEKCIRDESGIFYTTDLALRAEQEPILYTIDDEGYEIVETV